MSDPVDYVPFETTTAPQPGAANADAAELERLYEVPVELAVEIGRTHMTIRETLALGPGSIVTLNRLAGEPVDLLVNGKPIARGEVVVIDEEFGLRVTEVVTSPGEGGGSRDAGASSGSPAAGVKGETQITEVPGTAPAPVAPVV
jgi:flagellar motor switch protein FliN/FliY